MDWNTIMWIVCGGVWGLLIAGMITLRIVNRIRNRAFKEKEE